MLAFGLVEKLILENPLAVVGLVVATVAWFRGFKWWVLLPTIVSFCNSWPLPTIGFWTLLIMAVWGRKSGNEDKELDVKCPKCGRSLRGATKEMIGDTGVCPKCKTEFEIERKQ